MQTRLFTRLSGMALAVMLTLLVGSAGADDSKLEGTWLNEVKIVTCPPVPHAVIATFQSMTTYMRGGIAIEGGSPPTPPAVSHSAGHGIWERTGHHTFRVFFRSHFFDNLGRLVRIAEVTSSPSLIHGDLSGDGTNKITTFNPDGTITVTEGCNEATSQRFSFED